ncbi:DEAD/DEAH box helicase [Shewanella kaireitica]|uniref:DEAD/DEAH box helicase n=1 Tax=Shewanella kaireitica TaxID=212021 RepID=UPI00200EFF09|nr:DEAD/DEAH box helicase [Shewanella kaireitica]MCL1092797.1 DEAD/DEAH box helicase [Shewanella kaireitica]
MTLETGCLVTHEKFGAGTVEFDKGVSALVRFEHGIEDCLVAELKPLKDIQQSLESANLDNLREVIAKSQALTIRSINDSWGVFSKSRISLLPHQLWVCHKTLSEWPVNKLIADDVGLGKTIEAGLILWPLIAKKRVRRLLVLTPASLVEQWQQRLREMFDIRLTLYTPSTDTKTTDYWNTHHKVVASLPTLRKDLHDRHERMLEAEDWDLLIIDEAHHLNNQEQEGATQGYRFVEKLIENDKFKSKLFFTATPHRGKDFGFFALMKLLRPELFDPRADLNLQRQHLNQLVIRNNKQLVTDMNGKKLFKEVKVTAKTYSFTPEEQRFYDQVTAFIMSGQAYASSLNQSQQRTVQLVLIAMQKLAASSVAAIKAAIKGRIGRLALSKKRLVELEKELSSRSKTLTDYEKDTSNPELDDRYVALEAEFAETQIKVLLMEDELPRLKELLELANDVTSETKIESIIDVLENEFKDRTVVFFTEYKSTQALLLNKLHENFGHNTVSFINGDGRLDGVVDKNGNVFSLNMNRYDAAKQFNQGKVRFIICTEAGGEGIDLQDKCHSMIHVDLPWNPMRLHQRVGRLNRYGQTEQVEVITLRNPDTVESRIWNLLNDKIENVMRALGSAMDEPEDLMQLILGMTDARVFNELFSGGVGKNSEKLSKWFDSKAGTFGGQSAIKTVKSLVGHADKFEYDNLAEVPRLDLNDLSQFFESMLKLNHHRMEVNDEGLISFKTPKNWITSYGVKRKYDKLLFDRSDKREAVDILGVGHPIVENALNQAENFEAIVAASTHLTSPLFVYQIRDQLTGSSGNISSLMIGAQLVGSDIEILDSEQLLRLLNDLNANMPKSKEVFVDSHAPKEDILAMQSTIEEALALKVTEIGAMYRLPQYKLVTLILCS